MEMFLHLAFNIVNSNNNKRIQIINNYSGIAPRTRVTHDHWAHRSNLI